MKIYTLAGIPTAAQVSALPLNVYRTWPGSAKGMRGAATTAAIYAVQENGTLAVQTSAGPSWCMFRLGTDQDVTGFTTKLRVVSNCFVNATAPTVSFVVGLYAVAALSGATTAANPGLVTPITGSTITFTTPAASTDPTQANSVTADFVVPTAGLYMFGVSIDGTQATNSQVYFPTRLEVRNV